MPKVIEWVRAEGRGREALSNFLFGYAARSERTSHVRHLHLRIAGKNPSHLVLVIYFQTNLYSRQRDICGATCDQIDYRSILFTRLDGARCHLSSDLVPVNYEAASMHVRISCHRNGIVFFLKDFVANGKIVGPCPV
jgi:hypothetical protein